MTERQSGLYNALTKSMIMIDSDEYLQASKAHPQDFTRKRKMTFPDLIRFMITRRKGSTQNELEEYFDKIGAEKTMTQQAFSEARLKIKDTALSMLYYGIIPTMYESQCDTWNGYRVLAIDGSKIALPDVDLLGRIYGTMGADSSSPTAQASICYDILNKVVVDALIEPLAVDERTMALRHIKNLDQSVRFEKELVIADRGYASFELIHGFNQEGLSYLLRVKRGFNADVDAQSQPDGIITLHRAGYPDLPLRVIKFDLPSGETETLLTNLWDSNLTDEAFQALYFLRWPVEVKYDEVKNKLEIENFTGTSVLAIRQDFYATMYLSNIAAAAFWDAQAAVDQERDGKENKYRYQVNVNHEIGVLKSRLIYALTSPDPWPDVERILLRLARRVCPIKSGRSPKRNKFPRRSKFHWNSRSNS